MENGEEQGFLLPGYEEAVQLLQLAHHRVGLNPPHHSGQASFLLLTFLSNNDIFNKFMNNIYLEMNG
jgi:hypothetical protein